MHLCTDSDTKFRFQINVELRQKQISCKFAQVCLTVSTELYMTVNMDSWGRQIYILSYNCIITQTIGKGH